MLPSRQTAFTEWPSVFCAVRTEPRADLHCLKQRHIPPAAEPLTVLWQDTFPCSPFLAVFSVGLLLLHAQLRRLSGDVLWPRSSFCTKQLIKIKRLLSSVQFSSEGRPICLSVCLSISTEHRVIWFRERTRWYRTQQRCTACDGKYCSSDLVGELFNDAVNRS